MERDKKLQKEKTERKVKSSNGYEVRTWTLRENSKRTSLTLLGEKLRC